MIVQNYDSAPRRGASAHRGGGISFVSLLTGEEGAHDNFDLMIVDMVEDYFTPRHRHNFDQIRIMLDGHFEWAPDTPQPEGTIGYFAEGTYYTQKGVGPSRTLALQIGGASGDGYTSHRQLQAAIADLQNTGSFSDGVYTRRHADGRVENFDGYQAVWEHVHGRDLTYPAPRFQMPVIAFPDAFGWSPCGEGAWWRQLAVFNERGLSAAQLRVAAGATSSVGADTQGQLLFVVHGDGQCGGNAYATAGAIRMNRGERASIVAHTDSLFYSIGLPVFADDVVKGS